MKNYILLYSILFLCFNTLEAQNYKPMLSENSEWYVYHFFESSCNEIFEIEDDSVVNEIVYKKIVADPFCNWFASEITLLREDIQEKRVYILLPNLTEQILYDFNLNIGDDVTIAENEYGSFDLTLDSITDNITNYPDIIIPDNSKVFYLNWASNSVIWIEGIGSISGPLKPISGSGDDLMCHFNSLGEHDYNDPGLQISFCQGDVSNDIKEVKLKEVTIYPNPAKESIIISRKNTKKTQCDIYNISGLLIKSYSIESKETNLLINDLVSGLYLVRVDGSVQKLIVE